MKDDDFLPPDESETGSVARSTDELPLRDVSIDNVRQSPLSYYEQVKVEAILNRQRGRADEILSKRELSASHNFEW